jgi:hypothetical protein
VTSSCLLSLPPAKQKAAEASLLSRTKALTQAGSNAPPTPHPSLLINAEDAAGLTPTGAKMQESSSTHPKPIERLGTSSAETPAALNKPQEPGCACRIRADLEVTALFAVPYLGPQLLKTMRPSLPALWLLSLDTTHEKAHPFLMGLPF